MAKTNTKKNRTKGAVIAHRNDTRALAEFLSKNGQLLLPMVDLITESQRAVDEIVDMTGRAMIEALLCVSAEQVAGPRHQGRRSGSMIGWHGSQQGRVTLSERKLQVRRPRLRARTAEGSSEIEIPAYNAMQSDERLSERMLDIMMAGVSTRRYADVLPEMAESVGISKSAVSREFIDSSEAALKQLMERGFADKEILVVYIDGIIFASHHVLVAVGVDTEGNKCVLGMREGASENAEVACALLEELVAKGIGPERKRLFVIDGSKALSKAIRQVYGDKSPVQRCRAHKIRNVSEHLPDELKEQVKAVMRAAYKLTADEGIQKLKKQADWLEREHPSAAGSLREGLEETFTINRLGLTPRLMKSLATTNIIENPNGTARRGTGRVTRWKDGQMILRWVATSFLDAEKKFRKVIGYQDLWVLKTALTTGPALDVDAKEKAA